MQTKAVARIITDYMTAQGWQVDTAPGEMNIVYIEGMHPNLTLNDNILDQWNDLSLIIEHDHLGVPDIIFCAVATTEPGRASMLSQAAYRLGGVARIGFGQQRAWRTGFHRAARYPGQHPALVQAGTVFVYRDKNRDGKRDGDPISRAHGINQHSTSPAYKGGPVGFHSAGCLVRKYWDDHLRFMSLVMQDERHVLDKKFVFRTTVIDGKDIARLMLPS
jgi:hypothetical protein